MLSFNLIKCIEKKVGGAGTGGTLNGIARRFKEKNPTVRVVCVDPHGSTLAIPDDLNKVNMCSFYFVEGIGYDFVPLVLDRSLIDEWVKVSDKEAFQMARHLVKYEGLLCGGSSGALMHGAIQVAKTLSKTDRVVVILPDNIRNYLTKHALDDWMYAWDFYDAPRPLSTVSGKLNIFLTFWGVKRNIYRRFTKETGLKTYPETRFDLKRCTYIYG